MNMENYNITLGWGLFVPLNFSDFLVNCFKSAKIACFFILSAWVLKIIIIALIISFLFQLDLDCISSLHPSLI